MLHGYDVHFFTDASQIDVNVDSQMDVTENLVSFCLCIFFVCVFFCLSLNGFVVLCFS